MSARTLSQPRQTATTYGTADRKHQYAGPERRATGSSAARTKKSSSKSSEPAIPIPSTIVDKDGNVYRRGRFLGKGGFAKCYELTNVKTNEICAGKIVAKTTLKRHRAKEKLTSEIKIHASLDHQHIVKFLKFFEDDNFVYILLELCSNKSLMEIHRRRRALSEPEVRYFMWQIIEASEYMHKEKIIHRDLKLGNLFVNSDMEIKVGDFGLAASVEYDGQRKKTLCGTPNYIAPEILHSKGHSYEVDIWSIGCILFTMLVGKPPFETPNVKETYRKITSNDYEIPKRSQITEDAKDLIRGTLSNDPKKRPSLAQMKAHPFFTNHFVPAQLPASILTMVPTFDKKKSDCMPGVKKGNRQPLRSIQNEKPGSTVTSKKVTMKSIPTVKVDAVQRPRCSTVTTKGGSADPAKLQIPPPTYGAANTNTASTAEKKSSAAPKLPAMNDPKTSLHTINQVLSDVVATQGKATANTQPIPLTQSELNGEVWISKWVDYSNKYGLGYQLSDGSVGVLYNDATKMVLSPNKQDIVAIDRDSVGGNMTLCTLSNYPEEYNKKVTLLRYFRSYMTEHLLNGASTAESKAVVFVRKWIRTKHAIVFRLSSGVIQINFFDHTKLIVNTPGNSATYIDQLRKSTTYRLSDVANTNHKSIHEMASRLSYAADVVGHMIRSSVSS